MGPPAVVVLGVGPQRPIEMPSTEDEGPVEALGPHRLDHPLGVGIRIRCSEGRADDPHPLRAKHHIGRSYRGIRARIGFPTPTASETLRCRFARRNVSAASWEIREAHHIAQLPGLSRSAFGPDAQG
jgi:hypothetical protein